MQNFVFNMKTKVYFGKDQVENLGNILNQYGKKVMFVYGGGSIKRNGIYDQIISITKKSGLELVEFSGVEPNPTLKTAKKGIELAKKEKVDCVLCVGGGSTLDCGKAIALGALYDGNVWDFYSYKLQPEKALPIVGIATLAASGSDMSPFSVITNEETLQKNGIGGECLTFNEVILDPTYTFSVNAYHSAAGVADAMSHTMETYFSNNEEYLQKRMCEAVLKTLIEFGPQIIETPEDYEARAQVLWASSMALNGILSFGTKGFLAENHAMGHALSAKYDTTHGVSLALIHPKWYELCIKKGKAKEVAEFGRNVWGLSGDNDEEIAYQALKELSNFFYNVLKIPANLREADCGANKDDFKQMAESVATNSNSGSWFVPATVKDIEEIYNAIY